MSSAAENTKPVELDARAIASLVAVLDHYDTGSGRGALVPLDDLSARSFTDRKLQKTLEKALLKKLAAPLSNPAKEYICSKLAMMGSEQAVDALADLTSNPAVGDAALDALQSIPGAAPGKALRRQLRRTTGLRLVGCIHSLAFRREESSVGELEELLNTADPAVVDAAGRALGEIGSIGAATALKTFYGRSNEDVRRRLDDAMLVCAQRLDADGKELHGRALYAYLAENTTAGWVKAAAVARVKIGSGGAWRGA